MKQENIIFIALIVAAAVVLGTTIGVANSYSTIKELKIEHKTPVKTQDKDSSDTENEKKADEAAKKTEAEAAKTIADTSSETGTANTLTSAEAREINRMLAQLGYEQKDITNSVRSYQTGNNIKATGQIDGSTLESIVREVTLKKAQALTQ
ncbi:MAG: hypothetical protein ACM3UZ_03535 [Acidobacteriota bacterium]